MCFHKGKITFGDHQLDIKYMHIKINYWNLNFLKHCDTTRMTLRP